MTIEERRLVLHIICDLEDTYKWKELYKAFLQSAAEHKFVPAENWEEMCDNMANIPDPATSERLAARFVKLFTFATEGLDEQTAQNLLNQVRDERRQMTTQ